MAKGKAKASRLQFKSLLARCDSSSWLVLKTGTGEPGTVAFGRSQRPQPPQRDNHPRISTDAEHLGSQQRAGKGDLSQYPMALVASCARA